MVEKNDILFVDTLVSQIAAFIGSQKAVYASVPITTGARFIEWYKNIGSELSDRNEYIRRHRIEVIRKNTSDAHKEIEKIEKTIGRKVINPARFDWPEWEQDTYQMFWEKILEKYVDTIIFLDGWQYSKGCCFEYLTALKLNIRKLDESFQEISLAKACDLVKISKLLYNDNGMNVVELEHIANELNQRLNQQSLAHRIGKFNLSKTSQTQNTLFKDEILNQLGQVGNIAQFISFGPGGANNQRYLWINGYNQNATFSSAEEAITVLLEASSENRVNVRSFDPNQPKGNPFVYGLSDTKTVLSVLSQNASNGLYSIVNETIDINDGGVSGVALGGVIEFTPFDTPKGVDKAGVCQMPRSMGISILKTVYGISPNLDYEANIRVEFSVHPLKRGIKKEHTIIWELEEVSSAVNSDITIQWPNNFSKIIGDKAFGLLIADLISLNVPYTTVIGRTVAPFSFGTHTGSKEVWIRTAPFSRTPGKYSTFKGWRDPFQLLHTEDSQGDKIASVLCQDAVISIYSGNLLTDTDDQPLIEGVKGRGDLFMLGQADTVDLPSEVIENVKVEFNKAFKVLGPVEMEWVYDGKKAWVIQLHRSKQIEAIKNVIVAGSTSTFISFDASDGLERLRNLIKDVQNSDTGIKIIGNIGVTSHFGDLLRKANIPSVIERSDPI